MKKYLFVILLFTGLINTTTAQVSSNRNYVVSTDILKPNVTTNAAIDTLAVNRRKQAVSYFDGLGRPLQSVQVKASSSGKDIITPIEYDHYGREIKKFLPYADINSSVNTVYGSLRDSAAPHQLYWYNSANTASDAPKDIHPYIQTFLEFSPFARALENGAQGATWQPGTGRTMKPLASTNKVADSVQRWSATIEEGEFGTYTAEGYYNAGDLYKSISIDEHGKQVIEFTDKEGKTILKKVQLTASVDDGTGKGHYGWLCTYYIYDDVNNLQCVVQPKGVELLVANSWSMSYSSGVILTEQCFRYAYDKRSRMIMKKVPGAGTLYMVYDARDRLVMSQDANMREADKWMVTKYDALNRPAETGLWENATSFSSHQSSASVSTSYPTTSSNYEQFTKTFYDDYSWRSSEGSPLSATRSNTYDGYFESASSTVWPFPQDATAQHNLLKGMVTGTKTKILGTGSDFLYTVNFYDEKGRVIQTQSTNITGGTDIINTQYSWGGQPLLAINKIEKAGTNAQTTVLLSKTNYDAQWRPLKMEKKIATTKVSSGSMPSSWATISEFEYDEIGQLKKKELGVDPLETLNYEYNIRGWTLGMNRSYVKDTTSTDNWFGYDLGYDKTAFTVNSGNHSYTAAQYSGNISGMLWRSTGDDMLRKYDFTYDAANRFLSADFNQLNSNSFSKAAKIDFSVSGMSYDANGNIGSMNQKGWELGGSVTIDSLLYTYLSNSNKLQRVNDYKNDSSSKLGDFKYFQETKTSTDYTYDDNGNMLTDLNKKMENNTYNHLNLPVSIYVAPDPLMGDGGGSVVFTYDATGNKLKKVIYDTPSFGLTTTTTTTYIGNTVYETRYKVEESTPAPDNYIDKLILIGTEEGRARINADSSAVVYDYMIKDHLGNVRMVLTEETKTDMYPVATMEDANATVEESFYSNVSETRVNTPAGWCTGFCPQNPRVSKVEGDGIKIGPAILLKVMAGDKFNVTAKSWWTSGLEPSSPNSPVSDLLSEISTGVAGITNGHFSSSDLSSSQELLNGLTAFWQTQASTSDKPNAYVNWILLDERFNYVAASSGFDQVGADNTKKNHSEVDRPITKNGYLYVFVSNLTPYFDVYFDDLQVTHTRGPLVQEDHYYPFGLTMAGISSKALGFGGSENKIKFNGYEKQSEEFSDGSGLDWYDYKNRFYDNQIGRFFVQDELADDYVYYSPYQFAGNQVPNAIDLDGLEPHFPFKENINSTPLVASTTNQGSASLNTRMKAVTAPRVITPAYIANKRETIKAHTPVHPKVDGQRKVDVAMKDFNEANSLKNVVSDLLAPVKHVGQTLYGIATDNTEMTMKGAGGLFQDAVAYGVGYGIGKGFTLGISAESVVANNVSRQNLFHYTPKGNVSGILENGLQSRSGLIYATTDGSLTPIQAQINLALPANRGLPNALFQIDAQGLQKAGISPIFGPRPVTGGMTGAGGGTEVIFNKPIPPDLLKQIH